MRALPDRWSVWPPTCQAASAAGSTRNDPSTTQSLLDVNLSRRCRRRAVRHHSTGRRAYNSPSNTSLVVADRRIKSLDSALRGEYSTPPISDCCCCCCNDCRNWSRRRCALQAVIKSGCRPRHPARHSFLLEQRLSSSVPRRHESAPINKQLLKSRGANCWWLCCSCPGTNGLSACYRHLTAYRRVMSCSTIGAHGRSRMVTGHNPRHNHRSESPVQWQGRIKPTAKFQD